MYKRKQKFEGSVSESFFLWGPRQTGKSTLLKALYPDSLWFDLLLTDVFERFQRNPSQLREIIMATQPVKPVVIDEIQKIPVLLDEIHWLIENNKIRFILSGSSPRKIIRSQANLLGPAGHFVMNFFTGSMKFLILICYGANNGLLPRHYLSEKSEKI